MKKLPAIMLACVLLLGLFACTQKDVGKAAEEDPHPAETSNSNGQTIPHYVYTDDYPTLYADELRAIFGDYTLGERKETHIEGLEYFIKEQYNRSVDFYEWEITYTDACGQTMTRTMHNRWSFYVQQVEWLKDQIEEHFWSNYVVRYFDDLMDPDSFGLGSYCFCFIGRISSGWYNEETYAYLEIGEAYLEDLKKRTDPIPLYALSYPEIFDRYPIKLSVNVRLSEDGVEESEWTERFADAKARLDKMIAGMTEEIGTELNLHASVGRQKIDKRNTYIHVLRGERYEHPEGYIDGDFDRAIMDSYKGKFW